MQKFPTTLVK